MSTQVPLLGEAHELVHLGGAHRGRLLDEDVLAGLERLLREREVRRHRRRDHDRVERLVGEQVVVALRRLARSGSARPSAQMLVVEVADPGKVGEIVEVADEVRPPVVEADDADLRQSFQTLPSISWPFVALRKSTITWPRATTSA